jgi:hypothetical protein
MSNLFSSIVDAIGNAFHNVSATSYTAIAVVGIALIVFGILILRR